MSVHAFLPVDGKLVEVPHETARIVFARADRKAAEGKFGIRPVVVKVEKENGVTRCRVDFFAFRGAFWHLALTGQVRKVAEAAVAVTAVHAFALFGALGREAMEAKGMSVGGVYLGTEEAFRAARGATP